MNKYKFIKMLQNIKDDFTKNFIQCETIWVSKDQNILYLLENPFEISSPILKEGWRYIDEIIVEAMKQENDDIAAEIFYFSLEKTCENSIHIENAFNKHKEEKAGILR